MDQAVMECIQLLGAVLAKTPYDGDSYESLSNLSSSKVLKLVEQISGEADGEIKQTIVFVKKQFHTETISVHIFAPIYSLTL